MNTQKVLILGGNVLYCSLILYTGCGFVGRNLVAYLISNKLVSFVRVVDKVPPQVAWLNTHHKEVFNSPLVEFKSANLINPDSCKNAFATEGASWDFVINCAAETKMGQTDPVYKEGIYKLSLNCAKEAATLRVKHYVELSSGQVASSEKTPHKEDAPLDPWSFIAKWKVQVEKELSKIDGLNYTIIRPALVYGFGDKVGMTTRLIIGAVYNVVDDNSSTQGTISDIIADIFNIKVDYYGNLVSTVVDLVVAADEANDKHLEPWAEACRKDEIQNTPLTPHMDSELLVNKSLNLDGSKLRSLGFQYEIPKPTAEKFVAIVKDFTSMNVFPPSLSIGAS
ncbi:bifunctional polymyxin resistance protein arna [Holotrichia oblita]|uniref:Bifunctional polymyxin resistance protein arna n=1 Tax=Holotrichia oblita TaxID=644536 RepID=A0ACB9SZC0_HOLOL|nr:bifunctional polymyxin resistance protein arna [Holotrichia oblita]